MGEQRIHRAVSADGTEIVGRVQGQGPPLVLLHGRLDDGDTNWRAMLPSLADSFTCFVPSTRGRGLVEDGRQTEAARSFVTVLATPDELSTMLAAGLDEEWANYVGVAVQESQQTHLAAPQAPRPTDPSVLEQIDSPVLVLYGDKTPLRWLEDGAQALGRHLQDVEVRRLAGVGHFAPFVEPRAIANELISFFEAAGESA